MRPTTYYGVEGTCVLAKSSAAASTGGLPDLLLDKPKDFYIVELPLHQRVSSVEYITRYSARFLMWTALFSRRRRISARLKFSICRVPMVAALHAAPAIQAVAQYVRELLCDAAPYKYIHGGSAAVFWWYCFDPGIV